MNKELDYKGLLRIVIITIILYCSIQHYEVLLKLLLYLFQLLFPFLLGGAIAFIINVPMRALERQLFPQKENMAVFRRALAYILTLLSILGIIGIALLVIIPQISSTAMLIIKRVPPAFKTFQNWIYAATSNLPNVQSYIESLDINWGSLSTYAINLIKSASTTVFSSGISLVSGVIGGITNFIVAFIFSIYILLQKEKLSTQLKKVLYAIFKEDRADRILYISRLSNRVFSSFLSGQCVEALILGTMFFITLSLFRMPYALLIGVIISLTALIPIFGAFIGCFIGAFLIMMVNPIQSIWFIVIFLVLQQIEGKLIYPHVVGGSIGLPSIWVLVAVMVGGNLLGIAGILIFIPLSSVCYSLFREYIYKRLKEKNVDEAKWKTVPEQLPKHTTASKNPKRFQEKKKKEKEDHN